MLSKVRAEISSDGFARVRQFHASNELRKKYRKLETEARDSSITQLRTRESDRLFKSFGFSIVNVFKKFNCFNFNVRRHRSNPLPK